MKLLPLYTNCILKNDILLGGKFTQTIAVQYGFSALQDSKPLIVLEPFFYNDSNRLKELFSLKCLIAKLSQGKTQNGS